MMTVWLYFTKKNLWVIKNNKVIITGKRNKHDGLWDVPFRQQPNFTSTPLSSSSLNTIIVNNISTSQASIQEHTCNYILTLDKSKYEVAQYLYGCLFAPAISTLEKAIQKGNLISWPGINSVNFKKYVGTDVAHEKGHLDQERQNLRSTKTIPVQPDYLNNLSIEEIHQDAFPSKEEHKCHHCYSVIIPAPGKTEKGKSYSDQTGRFPYQSSRGNKYICVTYNYNANAFLFELLKIERVKI